MNREQATLALEEYINNIDQECLLYHDDDMMYYTGERHIVYIIFSDSDGIHIGTITQIQLNQQTDAAIEQNYLSKQLDELLEDSFICPECGEPFDMCRHGYYEEE